MYRQPAFAVSEVDALHDLIDSTGLCTIVSHGPSGLMASHIPMVLDRRHGELGTLRGHVALANPHWNDLQAEENAAVLVICLGPDVYVSPGSYVTKRDNPRVVPTWNYVALHAHGTARVHRDATWLRGLVEDLTDRHEADRAEPWSVDDAPREHVDRLLKAIVGVEIRITALDGSRKLSQNRAPADQRSVAVELASGDGDARAISALMMSSLGNEHERRVTGGE